LVDLEGQHLIMIAWLKNEANTITQAISEQFGSCTDMLAWICAEIALLRAKQVPGNIVDYKINVMKKKMFLYYE
jgi:hypothetical protein